MNTQGINPIPNNALRTNSSPSNQLGNDRINVLWRIHELGVKKFGFKWSAIRHLPKVLNENETLGGVVRGKGDNGRVLLAATDHRIIYIDKKPLFLKVEDISHDAISAITLEWIGFFGTLTLHTKMGDIHLRVHNKSSAQIFRRFVERRCIDSVRQMNYA